MRKSIERFLIEHDCPLEYMGFSILVEAIACSAKYVGDIKSNLKSIYIEVGGKFNISRLCIERNLRTLMAAWAGTEKFCQLFEDVPTNAKLIISLTHKCFDTPKPERIKSRASVYDILFS